MNILALVTTLHQDREDANASGHTPRKGSEGMNSSKSPEDRQTLGVPFVIQGILVYEKTRVSSVRRG